MYRTFQQTVGIVGDAFDRMGLPRPGEQDVYQAMGGRALVLMSDFGIVARFTPVPSMMRFDNEHFLKSLFQRKVSNDMYLDWDPEIRCPVTQDESDEIFDGMESRHFIIVHDRKRHNCGFLPGTDYPVLIDLDPNYIRKFDLDAVEALQDSVTKVKGFIQRALGIKVEDDARDITAGTPQDALYRDLRRAMKDAWPKDRAMPRPEGVKDFLQACAAYRKEGKLLSCWTDTKNSYGGRDFNSTTLSAANYAQKLRSAGVVPG